MHPTLHLSNLSTLPLSIRRMAIAAANGSDADWIQIWDRPDIRPSSFLPVLFALLDPARIPKARDLDDPHSALFSRADDNAISAGSKAVRALGRVGTVAFPVYQQLWPRVWRWIEFLDAHQQVWPPRDRQQFIYEVFLGLCAAIREPGESSHLVHNTPASEVAEEGIVAVAASSRRNKRAGHPTFYPPTCSSYFRVQRFYSQTTGLRLVPDSIPLSKRDDAFMHLILLREYQHNKLTILRQQLQFICANDGRTNFYTEFNFTGASCAITVKTATPSDPSLQYTQTQLALAAAPHSRLALLQMIFRSGLDMLAVCQCYGMASSAFGGGSILFVMRQRLRWS
ncbi:hypothetical protein C8R46DRAFT_1305052 [Mycena filopes]|nr:hypothetical protein C8R46DRAFT_1305052 [Mycena filopes]